MSRQIFIIIILILIMCEFLFSQGEWSRINSPVNTTLNCIYTLDSSNIWAAGDSGTIIYSSDWGQNWEVQRSNGTYEIQDLYFIDSLMGWSIGFRTSPPFTEICSTVDGGKTWLSSTFPAELTALRTIFFVDSLTGYVAGSSGSIFKTTDAGFKWNECRVDSFRLDINDIQFYDRYNGFACGGIRDLTGVVWRSSDEGETWSAIKIPFEPVWELYFFDSLNIIGIGGDLEFGTAIIRSYDSGYTWDYNSLSIFGVGNSISFRNKNEAWCTLGSDRKLIYSADTGSTWLSFPSPDSSYLFDLVFADSLHGIAVGGDGAVYIYKEKPTDVKDSKSEVPGNFKVYQNFPNPFNSTTRITYFIPAAADIVIRITDILGRVVYEKTEYAGKGENNNIISFINLSSGIYFYSINYLDRIYTGKMIYMK